jgi:hypothetical protein
LFVRTSPNIEKVKNPRYAKYFLYLASPSIYFTENKCTNALITLTTTSIIAEISSITKPTVNFEGDENGLLPISNQSIVYEYFPNEEYAINTTIESARSMKSKLTASQSPCRGSRLPKKIKMRNDTSGISRIISGKYLIANSICKF